MIGQTISHYQIIEKIGEGGMGVVYRAHDKKLERHVAIKFLSASHAVTEQDKTHFIHEARAASALEHPHICTIHEIDVTSDGQLFLVMPCYEGTPLNEKIEKGPLPINEAIDIAIQIADGLQAANEKGIVHRDIKSSNIFITSKGQVKVMDFGLARSAGMTQLTKSGMTIGTVPYMSPEQALGEKVDHRTDIWSLGVILYEMITGRMPFRSEYSEAIVYSILNAEPDPLTSLRSDVPMELEYAVKRALEKSPEDRYQSASDFVSDLRWILKHPSDKQIKPYGVPKRPPKGFSLRSGIIGGAMISLLILVLVTISYIKKPGTLEVTTDRKMLAVLPFENLGPAEHEYFADGVTEEIISRLSKISKIGVIARSSAMHYKQTDKPIRQIGDELGVGYILEGTIRWEIIPGAESRVRISPRLVSVADGTQMWSEPYESVLTGIFKLQADIAEQVADALNIVLLAEERRIIERIHTENMEAYNLYLQGVHFWNKRTPEGVKKSMMCFQEAIEKDPGFALPYAGLANSYNIIGYFGPLSPREAFPQARDLALKALELDEGLAEAHTSLGLALVSYYWDWAGAERAFKRAIELNPGYPTARQFYGIFLMFVGRVDEAIEEIRKAQELDPVSVAITWVLGDALSFDLQFDRAILEYKRAMELEPGAYQPYLNVVVPYYLKGMYEEAIAAARKAIELSGQEISPWKGVLASAHAGAGNHDEARKILDEVIALSEKGYVSPARIAYAYEALTERDKTFEWLYRAYEERDLWLLVIKAHPMYENLREDPRTKALLREMGLE